MGLERRQTCEKRPFNNPRSPRLRNPDQLRRGERYPSCALQNRRTST